LGHRQLDGFAMFILDVGWWTQLSCAEPRAIEEVLNRQEGQDAKKTKEDYFQG
jgi:hypothetical protein